jgi:hypothetical protein
MKYLKRIFEKSDNSAKSLDEVLDFCEGSLAYLLDDGWKLDVKQVDGSNRIWYNVLISSEEGADFSDIADYIIPFLTRLVDSYNLFSSNRDWSWDQERPLVKITNIPTVKYKSEMYLTESEIKNELSSYIIPNIIIINFSIYGIKKAD